MYDSGQIVLNKKDNSLVAHIGMYYEEKKDGTLGRFFVAWIDSNGEVIKSYSDETSIAVKETVPFTFDNEELIPENLRKCIYKYNEPLFAPNINLTEAKETLEETKTVLVDFFAEIKKLLDSGVIKPLH